MIPNWRMRLQEARRAFKEGRLEQASRIVSERQLRDFRQARELSAQIADEVALRAHDKFEAGQSTAGWRDMELARQIGGQSPAVEQLEQAVCNRSVERVFQMLASGQTPAAQLTLHKMAARNCRGGLHEKLDALTKNLLQAERLLAEGNSSQSQRPLESAHALTKQISAELGRMQSNGCGNLLKRIEELSSEGEQHRQASEQLLSAIEKKEWRDVLMVADRLLATAPSDKVALSARKQAWHEVGLHATQIHQPNKQLIAPIGLTDTQRAASASPNDTMAGSEAKRFLMWLDSVGGYLVCTDNEVVLGQPTPEQSIAVPILADLSRRHAVLRREANGYTLEALGTVFVDGKEVKDTVSLGNRHEIQLGDSVRLDFEKPHALSATARLTVRSSHRTQPRADAILLMAESCVLGPKSHCHVNCKDWPGELILFRQGEQLLCRATQPINVDGNPGEGPMPLDESSRIEGEDFALSLEAV